MLMKSGAVLFLKRMSCAWFPSSFILNILKFENGAFSLFPAHIMFHFMNSAIAYVLIPPGMDYFQGLGIRDNVSKTPLHKCVCGLVGVFSARLNRRLARRPASSHFTELCQ